MEGFGEHVISSCGLGPYLEGETLSFENLIEYIQVFLRAAKLSQLRRSSHYCSKMLHFVLRENGFHESCSLKDSWIPSSRPGGKRALENIKSRKLERESVGTCKGAKDE